MSTNIRLPSACSSFSGWWPAFFLLAKLHSSDHLPQHFGATTSDSSNKRNLYWQLLLHSCQTRMSRRKFAEKLILFVCPKLIINNLLSVIYWIKIIPFCNYVCTWCLNWGRCSIKILMDHLGMARFKRWKVPNSHHSGKVNIR